MFKEFKNFIMTGNVIEFAVAVIMAGAVGAVVNGFVNDIVMPIVGMLTGGVDFSEMKVVLQAAVVESEGVAAVPEVAIRWGAWVNTLVNLVIVGFVINVLVLGLTNFFYSTLLVPYDSTWNAAGSFSAIPIPVLSRIPIIGPVLFNQTIIVYIMYAIVILIQVALHKSRWGLRTRAVGELPIAADSVGIDVNKLRFRNVMLAGLVAGIGGAVFTIGAVGIFSQSMTAGAGFIALACLVFGKWTPRGALVAALFFGFADYLQGTLSIIGVPVGLFSP